MINLEDAKMIAAGAQYWPSSLKVEIKEDSWPSYKLNGEDYEIIDDRYLEFGGKFGVAVVVVRQWYKIKTLRGEREGNRSAYGVMRPYTWTEYGQTLVDYDLVLVTPKLAEMMCKVVELFLSDEIPNFFLVEG